MAKATTPAATATNGANGAPVIEGKTEQETQTILNRIKKLLERANSNVSPDATKEQADTAAAEAARALELATEMLTRYNLTSDTVLKVGDPRREIIEEATQYTKAGTPSKAANEWLVLLSIAVAEANFCRVLTGKRNIYWIGRRENVEVSKELMAWILPQFGRLTAASMQWVTEWKDRPRFRRSYRMGLAKQVAVRLHEARLRQQAGQKLNLKEGQNFGNPEDKQSETFGKQVQALVLRRQQEADQYIEDKYPDIKQREASKAQLDAFAQALGWEDGKGVSLISQSRQVDAGHLAALAADTVGASQPEPAPEPGPEPGPTPPEGGEPAGGEDEDEEERIPGVVTTPLRDGDERAAAEAAQAEAEASQEVPA